MTLHVQMLYEVAKHAKAMADAMQAIVDDCASSLRSARLQVKPTLRCSTKYLVV